MRLLLAALAATLALPASAQDRGHVRALGGATFAGETATIFAGGAGVRLTDALSLTVELGRMEDVTPDELADDIEALEAIVDLLPVDVSVDVRIPAFYGLAGLRADLGADERVRPYVEGGAGFASLSAELDASVAGIPIPNVVDRELGIEDETKFLLGLGGGIGFALSDSVGLDLAYRYQRIFDDPAIDVHVAYGAVRFGF